MRVTASYLLSKEGHDANDWQWPKKRHRTRTHWIIWQLRTIRQRERTKTGRDITAQAMNVLQRSLNPPPPDQVIYLVTLEWTSTINTIYHLRRRKAKSCPSCRRRWAAWVRMMRTIRQGTDRNIAICSPVALLKHENWSECEKKSRSAVGER